MRKKARIIKFLIFIIIIIIGSFGYYHARYIAPNDYKIKRTTINNKQLPKEFEDFEIAFISDINLKNINDLDRLDNIISTLNKVSGIVFTLMPVLFSISIAMGLAKEDKGVAAFAGFLGYYAFLVASSCIIGTGIMRR